MIGIVGRTAAAVLAALLLVSCTAGGSIPDPLPGGPGASPQPPDAVADPRMGGTLRIALSDEPATLDPRFLTDDTGALIVGALFEPLVRVDATGRVVPAAAERWTSDDEQRVFRFQLRDATFHDGTPVTADDFVRSFTRLLDGTAEPVSYLGYLLEVVEGASATAREGVPLEGIEAIDERTLEIRLVSRDPGFLTRLSDPSLVPVPASADEDLAAFAERPIGNGPFAMAGAREPGEFVRLGRFAGHHRPPLLDEVVFAIYGDAGGLDRQYDDLLDGHLHVAAVAPQRHDAAIGRFGASADGFTGPGVLWGLTSGVYTYGFDTTEPPFDDPRVRRAVSMAIDREAIVEALPTGTRAPATSLIPPSLPGWQPAGCTACRYDPTAAAALLAEVRGGAGDGEGQAQDGGAVLDRLTLAHVHGDTHAAIAERMASDIASALGIEVEVTAVDVPEFAEGVRTGTTPVFRLGWQVSSPDPGAYLRPLFHSSQVGVDNITRFRSGEVDALLDTAQETAGRVDRLEAYRVAEERILADMPVVPLLWYRHSTVVAPAVRGLVYSPYGWMNLDEVWLARRAS